MKLVTKRHYKSKQKQGYTFHDSMMQVNTCPRLGALTRFALLAELQSWDLQHGHLFIDKMKLVTKRHFKSKQKQAHNLHKSMMEVRTCLRLGALTRFALLAELQAWFLQRIRLAINEMKLVTKKLFKSKQMQAHTSHTLHNSMMQVSTSLRLGALTRFALLAERKS